MSWISTFRRASGGIELASLVALLGINFLR
jgi:hypothetical protein